MYSAILMTVLLAQVVNRDSELPRGSFALGNNGVIVRPGLVNEYKKHRCSEFSTCRLTQGGFPDAHLAGMIIKSHQAIFLSIKLGNPCKNMFNR